MPFGGGSTVSDCVPSSFISGDNASGSIREECILRDLIDGADESATIAADARARLFSPERVRNMVTLQQEFDGLADFMRGEDGDDGFDRRATGGDDAALRAVATPLDNTEDEEARRLAREIEREEPRPPAPRLVPNAAEGTAVWADGVNADGTPNLIVLTAKQYLSYTLLKDSAGSKQLLTFLSGEGGTGKSTLIRLLVQEWRSQGLRVRVCASSGKAARLIGGHTVHAAFMLHQDGFFLRSSLRLGSKHLAWLATSDIIIIDEISMLTADALDGVSQALKFAVSRGAGRRGYMVFGRVRSDSAAHRERRPALRPSALTPRLTLAQHSRGRRPVPAPGGGEAAGPKRPGLPLQPVVGVSDARAHRAGSPQSRGDAIPRAAVPCAQGVAAPAAGGLGAAGDTRVQEPLPGVCAIQRRHAHPATRRLPT